jgi:hypothetical protein
MCGTAVAFSFQYPAKHKARTKERRASPEPRDSRKRNDGLVAVVVEAETLV